MTGRADIIAGSNVTELFCEQVSQAGHGLTNVSRRAERANEGVIDVIGMMVGASEDGNV